MGCTCRELEAGCGYCGCSSVVPTLTPTVTSASRLAVDNVRYRKVADSGIDWLRKTVLHGIPVTRLIDDGLVAYKRDPMDWNALEDSLSKRPLFEEVTDGQ